MENKLSLRDSVCLIVEDQVPAREFIAGVVGEAFPGILSEAVPDLRRARGWLEAKEYRKTGRPLGLVIVDLGLPDGCGIEVLRLLAEAEPGALPVVFTIYGDDTYLFGALSAGAKGYLLKEESPTQLAAVLKRLEAGEPPLSPSIARRMLSFFQAGEKPPEAGAEAVRLTPREQETLVLLARGLTIPEAAGKMGLSPQTVAGYVKVVYQKLHVSNRVELVREASRRRLI
jgi:DNA-binding NarL/FixJ family response regulator